VIGDWLPPLVAGARSVLDAGCGPAGSWWWPHKRPDTALVAVDLFFKPEILPPRTRFVQADLVEFCESGETAGSFDLIVADHILEHVPDMAAVCHGLSRLLAECGTIHVGIPDARMFSDRFYHLVHPEGGGHISKPTLESVTELMSGAGMIRVDHRPWPEDWRWLRDCYDWKGRNIQHFSQEDVHFIVDVFLKELTPEKGYFYGWEILFRKAATATVRRNE
jgi:SAM-dependent methyltransferase